MPNETAFSDRIPSSPKVTLTRESSIKCQICGVTGRIDEYGVLQICQHKYGGGKNGRLYVFDNLEDVLRFEKGGNHDH